LLHRESNDARDAAFPKASRMNPATATLPQPKIQGIGEPAMSVAERGPGVLEALSDLVENDF